MTRDKLFLVQPDFVDPALPGQRYYCWHCALLEGVLAYFPALQDRIEVVRLPWARPRQALIDLGSATDQSLPLLVREDGPASNSNIGRTGRQLIRGKDEILQALTDHYGLPHPHP